MIFIYKCITIKAIGGTMNDFENFYTTDTISKLLPERLKFFRNKARLTTYDVGEKLNKTPSTVTLWETGKAQPDVKTILKICNIYKISDVNELIGNTEKVEIKNLNRTEQELIQLWRNSKPHVRAAIKTLLKECKDEKKE